MTAPHSPADVEAIPDAEVAQFDIRFEFQDGDRFTIDDLRAGRGLFDDALGVPVIVGRRIDNEDGEWLELGDEFRDEYESAWLEERSNLAAARGARLARARRGAREALAGLRTRWEREVLQGTLDRLPAVSEVPDVLNALTSSMLHVRDLPAAEPMPAGERADLDALLVEDENGAPYPDEVQRHFREAYAEVRAHRADDSRDKALREVAALRTHNGTPVTAENLRWAATHEALSRSWIGDVLMGIAGILDGRETTGADE